MLSIVPTDIMGLYWLSGFVILFRNLSKLAVITIIEMANSVPKIIKLAILTFCMWLWVSGLEGKNSCENR